MVQSPEVYFKPCQTSCMKHFYEPLTFFAKQLDHKNSLKTNPAKFQSMVL